MSSPTTSPATAGSTSTSATAPTKSALDARAHAGDGDTAAREAKAVPLQRVGLRKKGATLSAVRATHPAKGTLADGTEVLLRVGDWAVYIGTSNVVSAVIPHETFPGSYEIVAEGTLTLSKADREAIEATTGVGTTQTPAALVLAIGRLARISIGDVQVPFTPGQLEELQHRATKRGQTVQQAIQAVVDRIRDEIFHRG